MYIHVYIPLLVIPCWYKVSDARRLYVLGLDFLVDHIRLAMGTPQQKNAFKGTTTGQSNTLIGP